VRSILQAMVDEDFIREGYEAWNQGDFGRMLDRLDPGVEIDASSRVLNPEVYHGHEGFRRMVDEMAETWDEWQLEPEAFIDHGDTILVDVRVRARGRGSGIELDQLTYNVWELQDGKVVRMAIYSDREGALRDAAKEQSGAEPRTRRT
jgi:ketosteroid isomerase-like protein